MPPGYGLRRGGTSRQRGRSFGSPGCLAQPKRRNVSRSQWIRCATTRRSRTPLPPRRRRQVPCEACEYPPMCSLRDRCDAAALDGRGTTAIDGADSQRVRRGKTQAFACARCAVRWSRENAGPQIGAKRPSRAIDVLATANCRTCAIVISAVVHTRRRRTPRARPHLRYGRFGGPSGRARAGRASLRP